MYFPIDPPNNHLASPQPSLGLGLPILPADPSSAPLCLPAGWAHMSGEITMSADGPVATLRCACGGRRELLLDAGPKSPASTDAIADYVDWIGSEVISPWALSHVACGSPARAPVLPDQASRLAEAVWASSVERIESGYPICGTVYALMSDGATIKVPLDQSAAGPVPEVAQANDTAPPELGFPSKPTPPQPLAVALVAEAWATPMPAGPNGGDGKATSRKEALAMWVTTPSIGIVRIATVSRKAGPTAEVGQTANFPLGVACPVVDGLLAQPVSEWVTGQNAHRGGAA
ncbi:MAG: hypothetical protein ACYCVL_07135 [Gemmatimonadaceae bacterium]